MAARIYNQQKGSGSGYGQAQPGARNNQRQMQRPIQQTRQQPQNRNYAPIDYLDEEKTTFLEDDNYNLYDDDPQTGFLDNPSLSPRGMSYAPQEISMNNVPARPPRNRNVQQNNNNNNVRQQNRNQGYDNYNNMYSNQNGYRNQSNYPNNNYQDNYQDQNYQQQQYSESVQEQNNISTISNIFIEPDDLFIDYMSQGYIEETGHDTYTYMLWLNGQRYRLLQGWAQPGDNSMAILEVCDNNDNTVNLVEPLEIDDTLYSLIVMLWNMLDFAGTDKVMTKWRQLN